MDIQNILNKWLIRCDFNNLILPMWSEEHRHYHSLSHLNDLLIMINNDKDNYTEKDYEKLILVSIFHDIIYDPKSLTNEEDSANFFINCCIDKMNPDILHIKEMILDTKSHKPKSKLSKCFIKYDMNIVERDFDKLLEWEEGIAKEYSFYSNYKNKRLDFLESLLDKYPNNTENLLKLIDWVKNNYD